MSLVGFALILCETRLNWNSYWIYGLMLSSLADITTFDVTLLQGVLTTMGSGMVLLYIQLYLL